MRNNKIKIVLAIVTVIVLAAVCAFLLRGVIVVLNDSKSDATEKDPMFAEPTEIVTRPPELDAEETQPAHSTLDDYTDDVSSPVDKTADELIEKAQQAKS